MFMNELDFFCWLYIVCSSILPSSSPSPERLKVGPVSTGGRVSLSSLEPLCVRKMMKPWLLYVESLCVFMRWLVAQVVHSRGCIVCTAHVQRESF